MEGRLRDRILCYNIDEFCRCDIYIGGGGACVLGNKFIKIPSSVL
jgi:hypothetical protein